MSKVNDKQFAIARTYSRALLQVSEEKKQADEVLEELAWLADYASENEDFGGFVDNPLLDPGQRAGSIEKMFRGKLSDVLVDTLQVMNRKGRLEILPAVAEAYRQDHRDARNRVDVQVSTAVPLADELREKLRATLAKSTGKTPDLHEEVDPGLIGGIVLRVGDSKVDASVKNEVRKYRKLLLDLAAREILGSREDALIQD
jgi:F-type H+-transporting ATPase subunit delta